MPVDYSKFDAIVDSDDEKPAETKKATPKAAAPVEKPSCQNCGKDVAKPLRCGVCKKVSYCSAKCQKEDWQFHKRNCQKPEEPKPKAKPRPKEDKPAEARRPKAEEKVVDNDNDEKITWYKHREWKPSAEPKKEFTPQQIAAEAAAAPGAGDGSVWNAAGTWEDKDATSIAKSRLAFHHQGIADLDVAGGTLSVLEVNSVEGEASKPVIRGRLRHMFDLSFSVKFVFKWMQAGGQRKAEGSVKVCDFTNDAYTDAGTPPVFQVSFKDAKLLDAGRKQAVEEAIGGAWPAPAGTLMANVASRMKAFSDEFQEQQA